MGVPEAFTVVAMILVLAGAASMQVRARSQERETLRSVALRLGADEPAARSFWTSETAFHGSVRGLGVDVKAYTRSAGKSSHRRIRVTVGGVPPGLVFRKQGLLDDAWQAVAGEDHQVGDPAFDAAVVVGGDPFAARLALDAETRALLVRAVGGLSARVKDGVVEIDVRRRVRDAAWILERVDILVSLVERLRRDGQDLEERLVALTADPSPLMRRQALLALHGRSPARAVTVAEGLRADPDASTRAVAADILGDLAVLRRVLVAAVDPDALVRAARALALHHDADAEPALITQAAHADARVRVAVADALGEVGTIRAVETLLPLTKGLLADGDARAAASAAIAAIQVRAGDVAAGRVALADEAGAGRVALAEGVDGRVALAEGRKQRT